MGAILRQTVVSGGVVYPAGTPATDDLLARVTNSDLWEEAADVEDDFDPEHPNTVLLRSTVQFIAERHLEDPEAPIADLIRDALAGLETDETPEVPNAPETPEAPDASEAKDEPETPETPEAEKPEEPAAPPATDEDKPAEKPARAARKTASSKSES